MFLGSLSKYSTEGIGYTLVYQELRVSLCVVYPLRASRVFLILGHGVKAT